MRASAEWKPKLRWLIRRILLLRPSRRPLESPSGIAARMPSRCARRVRARRTNGFRRERDAQASQASRWAGAVERAVGLLDFPEGGELSDRLSFGRFEQRPAGALDPAPGRGMGAFVGVPFVAADLVGRA